METIDNQAAIEAVFHTYFNDGYFESRSGEICLTLYPKRWAWLPSDKQKAWDAVVAKFSDDPRWYHTDVMKQQFYCHARFVYQLFEREWNLEPWRTSMDFFTCN